MKTMLQAWQWSLVVAGRSFLPILVFAVLVFLWCYAGYRWLWVPLSSGLVLTFLVLWVLALVGVAVALIAGLVAGAGEAAETNARQIALRTTVAVRGCSFVRVLLMLVVIAIAAFLIYLVFGWINHHALTVASFLTFQSSKPVSHLMIRRIFLAIETVVVLGLSGFFLTVMIVLVRAGRYEARRHLGRALKSCCLGACLLTSLVSVGLFGGLASWVANWRPQVAPGTADYIQLGLRMGGALVLLVVGSFVWTLALARLLALSRESSQGPSGDPAAADGLPGQSPPLPE